MSQLADGRLIGKLVKCAKCSHEFKCEKMMGPVLWAIEVKSGNTETSFEKAVTKVIFTYGVAVPISHQERFMSHLGVQMAEGARRNANIRLGGKKYAVKVSYFRNRKGEPSLHFLWKSTDPIAIALKSVLQRAYAHFIVERNTDFLGGEIVVVSTSTDAGVFDLAAVTQGNDIPVQGNLFASQKRGRGKSLSSSLKDDGVKDLLSELSI